MTRFPDLPIYTGFNAPGRCEADIFDLEVTGNLPMDLDGAFYRVAPDPQWPPLHDTDIYFNGDGLVCMFRFKNGHVDFKSRYARTDKYNLERAARHALFGSYRNPLSDDPSVRGKIRGTANTNVVFHAGKLLALKEDSPAVAMDPLTLATIGNWDFHGTLQTPTFTAHPKLDPHTGEMIAFGYDATGIATTDIVYNVIDASGKATREVWFKAPYSCMVHDFGVSRDYVIFPIVPITSSLERIQNGKMNFGWDSSKDVYIGVLPRTGEARDLRWFRGPCQFTSHVMNAFNEGTRIHFDVPVSESNGFPFFPDISGKPFDPKKAECRMTRWSLDFNAPEQGFEARQLSPVSGEFPRIDNRYAMEPYRHGYLAVQDLSKPFDTARAGSITGMFWNSVGHIDHATGKTTTFFAGATSSLQEPTFIPKSAHAREGEGYLVALANRYEEMRSDLLVLDAEHLDEGPIATIRLPIKLRNGLHGNWVSGAQLKSC